MDHRDFAEAVGRGEITEERTCQYVFANVMTEEHAKFMAEYRFPVSAVLNGRLREDEVPMVEVAKMIREWNAELGFEFIYEDCFPLPEEKSPIIKHDLGQLIYYMLDNKVHSAPVLARTLVDNSKDYDKLGTETMSTYAPWGKEGVWYKTIHGIIEQEDAFATKQELLDSL